MTKYDATVSETSTVSERRPSRGRSVGLVAFLFGMTGRAALPGTGLRALLGDLGLSEQAARALLARMCRDGQLAGQRHGRTVDYSLAGDFAVSFARVRDQAQATSEPWSGHFFAVLYHVREEHRAYRDSLRRSAVLAGYGVLQPGVLICPVDRSSQLGPALTDRPESARIWTTTLLLAQHEAADAASIAWDLPELDRRYRTHIEQLGCAADGQSRSPVAGPEALRAYVGALQPVLTDTLREPRLPPELLPAGWPGRDLRAAIGRCTAAFNGTTDAYVRALLPTGRTVADGSPVG